MGEATWWRLVHHLAVGLGAPLADAARATDTLLSPGMHPGRVRLRATSDESVSIAVDLARFQDASALALAAAQFLAVPRPRGRPRTNPVPTNSRAQFTPDEMASVLGVRALAPADRLAHALNGLPGSDATHLSARQILKSLLEGGVPLVVIGDVAEATHSAPWEASSLDICADLTPRYATAVAKVLNALGAQPRGASVREGFRIDAALVRAVPMLALRVGTLDVNIQATVGDVGEYQQVVARSIEITFDSLLVRVISIDALVEAAVAGPPTADSGRQQRKSLLRALHALDSATR